MSAINTTNYSMIKKLGMLNEHSSRGSLQNRTGLIRYNYSVINIGAYKVLSINKDNENRFSIVIDQSSKVASVSYMMKDGKDVLAQNKSTEGFDEDTICNFDRMRAPACQPLARAGHGSG